MSWLWKLDFILAAFKLNSPRFRDLKHDITKTTKWWHSLMTLPVTVGVKHLQFHLFLEHIIWNWRWWDASNYKQHICALTKLIRYKYVLKWLENIQQNTPNPPLVLNWSQWSHVHLLQYLGHSGERRDIKGIKPATSSVCCLSLNEYSMQGSGLC